MNKGLVCYLCGKEISEFDLTYDHVPPRQFFPSELRNGLELDTLPAHHRCNTEYGLDEEYFVKSIGSLTMLSSPSGKALWNDIKRGLKRDQGAKLAQMISDEFINRTEAGIILPESVMLKKFDDSRVWRIIWKIVRGLFFKEKGIMLPENKLKRHEIIEPKYKRPSEAAQLLVQTPSKGKYPDIFDYKYFSTNKFHYWGFCLWQDIVMTTLFHIEDCKCLECVAIDGS